MTGMSGMLGGWFLFNAIVLVLLMSRRVRPHLHRKLFHWVICDRVRQPRRGPMAMAPVRAVARVR